MYQEMVYYNRMHVKTRLSQSILSKIVGQAKAKAKVCLHWQNVGKARPRLVV